VLAGRLPLPGRDEWSDWLARDSESATARRIRHVLALEELGAEVVTVTADIAETGQVAAAVRTAHRRFGELHGVIHLAGILESGKMAVPVTETDERTCDWHFRPKVHGLYALEAALAGEDLDFCLLFSSSSAVLGGLGFTAYAAANAFMDAYVRQHNRRGGPPWLSVDWDPWGAGDEAEEALGTPRSGLADLAMSPAESTEAFDRVLSLRAAEQVLVSVGDLEIRFAQWLRVGPEEKEAAELAGAEPPRHPRPSGLQNAFVPPITAEQQAIARLWQSLLGIEPIGLHDNFFELGGDSLRATQILSGLRRIFQVEIPLRALLEATTIAHQAVLVTARQAAGAAAAQPGPGTFSGTSRNLADQLAELESLARDDAQMLLKAQTQEDLKMRVRL
jgi:acyl carrier protein